MDFEALDKSIGVPIRREPWSGDGGVHKQTLPEMARLIRQGQGSVGVKSIAAQVLRDAGFPESTRGKVAALRSYVRTHVGYVNDMPNREFVQAAELTLCSPDAKVCMPIGDCFTEGTLLLRDNFDLVPIEQVKIGYRIWGRGRWSLVDNVWFKGRLSIDAIEMNNGSTMYLTPGHKVYVGRCDHGMGVGCEASCKPSSRIKSFDRVHVSDLHEGDALLQPERINFGIGDPDPGRMYIEGLALADGWTESDGRRFRIAGRDGMRKEAQKHEVQAICTRLGIDTTWHRRYIEVRDREWTTRLMRLGTRARFKRADSLNLTEPAAQELLRGLMADSTQNTNSDGRTYSTTSYLMATQVRVLHRMFGRSTSIRMLTPEQHRGAGKHPLWRVGIRVGNKKVLAVRSIERNVKKVPCWDISTDDHYVYLPEHDVTVSNCDDTCVALGSLIGSAGIDVRIVEWDYGPDHQRHVLLRFYDDVNKTWPTIDGTTDRPIGWVNPRVKKELVVDPFDPKLLPESMKGGEFVGVGKDIGAAGALFTTPDDVLAYRRAWEPYVAQSLVNMRECADAIDLLANNISADPARTKEVTAYRDLSQYTRETADPDHGTIVRNWNRFQGLTSEQIVRTAPYILQGHQLTVREVNSLRNLLISVGCRTGWPDPPSIADQLQIVARLEGIGILARGSLVIMAKGASDTVDTAAAAAHGTASVLRSPWLWAGVIVVSLTTLGLVYAPEVKSLVRRTA